VIRSEASPKPPKKAYQTPELRNYGSISDITRASTHFGTRIDSRSPIFSDRTH
jgi:hypothetical protein